MEHKEINDSAVTAPKYRQIYNQLRSALEDKKYKVGDKLPSENDLVEQFGASRPTVARALAQLENEGWVERRAGSGTFVRAQNASEGFVFGLLIPGLGTTEIFEPICRGISIARVGGHHDLLWGSTLSTDASSEAQAAQLCQYYLQRKVSGIFFAPLELSADNEAINQRIAAASDEAHIPMVLLDRDICAYPRRSKYDLISIDNRRAGFAITQHVLSTGAKRLIFLARPGSAPTVVLRAAGFREAVESESAEGWVEICDPTNATLITSLIERHQAEAVVCANDFTAAQLMNTLNALSIEVPGRIKITGFDDLRYASLLQTPLTTIHQPCLELGAVALAAMLDRISNPSMPVRDYGVNFELIIRQSTGEAVPAALPNKK